MTILEYILRILLKPLHKHKKLKKPNPPTNLKANLNMAIANLTWTLPTTRVDGSPLATTDIASVQVYDVSTASPSHDKIADLPGPVTSFTTDTLTVGFHNFTVEVTDTTGHVSADSNTATVEVIATLANPSPPTNLTAVLA